MKPWRVRLLMPVMMGTAVTITLLVTPALLEFGGQVALLAVVSYLLGRKAGTTVGKDERS